MNLNRAIRGPVTAVPVVAGRGVRIVPDTANNRFVAEVDETVLYDVGSGTPSGTATLSESPSNFERIGITYYAFDVSNSYNYIELPTNQSVFSFGSSWSHSNAGVASFFVRVTLSSLTLTCNRQSYVNFNSPSAVIDATSNFNFYKVVGINRIASN